LTVGSGVGVGDGVGLGVGVAAGVTLLDAAEGKLSPIALLAFTVKVYAVPLVRSMIVIGDAAAVAKAPPGKAVTL